MSQHRYYQNRNHAELLDMKGMGPEWNCELSEILGVPVEVIAGEKR